MAQVLRRYKIKELHGANEVDFERSRALRSRYQATSRFYGRPTRIVTACAAMAAIRMGLRRSLKDRRVGDKTKSRHG